MWFYKNKKVESVSDLPEHIHAFIYKITHKETGKFYIGKKNIYSERNIPLTKKEILEYKGKGRVPKKKLVIKESDWMLYYGSEPVLKEDIKKYGKDLFIREIIYICFNKKQTTYQELRHQILEGCLESDNCYCSNILGKFFKKDLV
jgi:hypothetical protein